MLFKKTPKSSRRSIRIFGNETALNLTAAYSVFGRNEEARAAAAEVLRIEPKFSIEYFSKTIVYKNPVDRDRFIEALRKAGLK